MSAENHSLLRICVHPEKNGFGFVREDEWTHEMHVHVRSKPENNQANAEIVRECTKLFGAEVKVLRGEKTPHKVLEVFLAKEELQNRLRQLVKKQPQKITNKNKK